MGKLCRLCGLEFDFENFHKKPTNKDGLDKRCKKCSSLYHKNHYVKNILVEREKRRLRDESYRRDNPEAVKSSKLKYRYGITLEEKEKMIDNQGGKCAVCDRPIIGKSCVDHNHQTGQVREILCGLCNTGLGAFGDNVEILKNAINYLQKWNT